MRTPHLRCVVRSTTRHHRIEKTDTKWYPFFYGDSWVDRSIHASKPLNTLQFTLKSCNFRRFSLLFHRLLGRLLAPICRTRVRFFGGIFTQLSIHIFLSSRSLLHFYGERRERKRTLAMIFVPCNVVAFLYDDDVQRNIRSN